MVMMVKGDVVMMVRGDVVMMVWVAIMMVCMGHISTYASIHCLMVLCISTSLRGKRLVKCGKMW